MPRAKSAQPSEKDTPATPPQVVLEHTSLFGERHRVVIMHAPGIDYFVVVEKFEKNKWTPVKRKLSELFSEAQSIMDIAVLQLAERLSKAEEELASLKKQA